MASSTANKPVFVITGTSGAGKGTLVQELLKRVPEVALAVSATTRGRRPGEVDGVHYWFISDEEFDRRLAEDDFLEYYAFPWGQRSGTLWSELDRIRDQGKAPLLELEPNGALAVKGRVPDTVLFFIHAPDFEELERRLRERATESAGEIEERLALSRRQLDQAEQCDYLIVNDEIERAAEELAGIVRRALDGSAVAGSINTPPAR
ncbi:MAG TPA: guanylate kinase [Gaiellaceae bacterium]|nr:guanylate kinase [Gaiellaceae bacterium]